MHHTVLKVYYSLTKPGIIYGNLLTVTAGFLLATHGKFVYPLLPLTLLGISLIIASGCVFNNIIDRDIDGKMQRTKERVLVKNLIPVRHAYIFASVLAVVGTCILYAYTNTTALLSALVGLFFYVCVYSLWTKRFSIHGTLLGSISGAMPPVVGYTAVTGQIDAGAIILFFILAIWQMPHSYAIAVYRLHDYKNAGIPVLPLKSGMRTTKFHIVGFTLLFIATTLMLYQHQYAGNIYLLTIFFFGICWLFLALEGLRTKNNLRWAKQMFFFSIIIIVVFSLLISFDAHPH